MTRENKIQFGIILVAAMHSEIYDYDLEEGMRQALSDTFINEEELNSLSDERKDSYIGFIERQKTRLHKQSLFLADAAINNMPHINWQLFNKDSVKSINQHQDILIETKEFGVTVVNLSQYRNYFIARNAKFDFSEVKAYAIINPSKL